MGEGVDNVAEQVHYIVVVLVFVGDMDLDEIDIVVEVDTVTGEQLLEGLYDVQMFARQHEPDRSVQ